MGLTFIKVFLFLFLFLFPFLSLSLSLHFLPLSAGTEVNKMLDKI